MSDIALAAGPKKGKKDTLKVDQWADTKDPFVNQLYKRLRNNQKKLIKIQEVEQKIKSKEIQANPEQLDKVSQVRKDQIKAEMDEVISYLKIYQEAFPDNVALGKKKAPRTASPVSEVKTVEIAQEPAVDVNKVVEDALSFVADTVILGTLCGTQGVALHGSSQNLNDSLAFVRHAWTDLTSGSGTWSAAKGHFVDTFSRLVFKSATQVGSHTSKSYSDLHSFITAQGQALFLQERTPAVVETTHSHAHKHHHQAHHAHAHQEEEEKGGVTEEGTAVVGTDVAGGDVEGANHKSGEWRGRGGNRGANRGYRGGFQFKKHNTDEEGFIVVKDEEAHHQHYASRRHQRGARGDFHRGGRGGEHRGGEHQHHGEEHPIEHTIGEEQHVAGAEQRVEGGEHRGRGGFRGERGTGEYRGGRGGDRSTGEYRGQGEYRGSRGGEHRGTSEYRGGRGGEFRGNRGEFRGSRGGRGGERGVDRPWTDRPYREHRGRGEVRRSDVDNSAWGDAPASTTAPATAPVVATETTPTVPQ